MEKTDLFYKVLHRDSTKQRQLQEVNLSNKELNKTFNGTETLRGEKFLDKVRKAEPFEMSDGTRKFINISGSSEVLNKMQKGLEGGKITIDRTDRFVVVDTEDLVNQDPQASTENGGDFEKVSIGSFKKTEEFGSRKETVAGSTEDIETCVAIFLAYKLQTGKDFSHLSEDFNSELENTLTSGVVLDKKYTTEYTKQCIDTLIMDVGPESWMHTIHLTVDSLIHRLQLTGNYTVYRTRTEGVVGRIYSTFNKYNTRYGKPDKWNPADIWVVRDGYEFPETASWEEFNQAVRIAFDQKNAIGISLKKVGKQPEVELVNGGTRQTDHHLVEKDFNSVKYLLSGKVSCKINFVGKLQLSLRCSNVSGGTSFAIEVLRSAAARDGKAGIPAINYELKKQGSKLQLPKQIGLLSDLADNLSNKDSREYKEFKNLVRQYIGSDQLEEYLEQSTGGKISKYLGLLCCRELIEGGVDKLGFINGILDYAMSRTDEAAPHYKVH